MLLTEAEAQKRWCPFVRAVFQPMAVGFDPLTSREEVQAITAAAGNAVELTSVPHSNAIVAVADRTPAIARCIASECMAWREIEMPEEEVAISETEPPDSDDLSVEWRYHQTRRCWVAYSVSEFRGYCGLAGQALR